MTEGNILAIIPARGCKDEVPHMNIRELGNHPLVYYTIEAVKKSSKINRVVVSTEDERVKEVSLDCGAEVPFLRPENMCNGDITLADVVEFTLSELHATEGYRCDVVVVLLPNAPFKTAHDIDKMIEHLEKNNLDSVMPLCQRREFFWQIEGEKVLPANFDARNRRIEAEPVYEERGGIYVYRSDLFSNLDNLRLGKKRGYYLLRAHNAQTIHSIYDFFILERLVKLPAELIEIMVNHEDGPNDL